MKSIKVVFIKQNKERPEGTLYIRTIENRKSKKKSLKITLTESEFIKYFLEDKQRFREDARFKKYSEYNDIINSGLEEVRKYEGNLELIPNKNKSFIEYWDVKIKNISNHGTRIKNEVVLSKLIKYLKSVQKEDLKFSEITPLFLGNLKFYLSTASDPKKLSSNSVVHYMKMIKAVLNKAIKEDHYSYIKNPFNTLSFSTTKNKKPILNKDEVVKILDTKISNNTLNFYRNMFLFQMFSNGMRVSDLFLLKWANISNGRLNYRMFKTGLDMSIPINLNMAIILSDLDACFPNYKSLINSESISIKDENGKIHSMKMKLLEDLIENLQRKTYTYNPLVNRYLTEFNQEVEDNMGRLIKYKGYNIEADNQKLKEIIDAKEKLQNNIDRLFIETILNKINELLREETSFIFPVLPEAQFKKTKKVIIKNNISESQYKLIKHNTIVYNRNLKKVQEICKIETNLSTHVARHTFTNLLIGLNNVNLYDIRLILGHSSVKITENYLSEGFNSEKLDHLSNSLSGKFRKS